MDGAVETSGMPSNLSTVAADSATGATDTYNSQRARQAAIMFDGDHAPR
jgi:hypothetical protein